MNPFDRAWVLLKMPIVPHSLRQVGERKHEARFLDPVSGEELPMTATEERGPMWSFKITDNEGKRRAFAPFESDSGTIASVGSETEEPYRRRGYMTALYDMAARLAHDDKEMPGSILIQGGEEEDGMGDLLWEKQGGFWPIRDDLYEGAQSS
mgnify:CR=1 FL=1